MTIKVMLDGRKTLKTEEYRMMNDENKQKPSFSVVELYTQQSQ